MTKASWKEPVTDKIIRTRWTLDFSLATLKMVLIMLSLGGCRYWIDVSGEHVDRYYAY